MSTYFQTRGFAYSIVSLVAFSLASRCIGADEPTSPQTSLYDVAPYIALRQAIALLPAKDQQLVTQAELELYRKVTNGKAKNVSPIEAVLTIDGVTDEDKRQQYRDRLDEITAEARKQTAKAKTQKEKLTILAKYLRDTPCHAGYTTNQVDLSRLLDRGDFNCVSASILFNLVATRLDIPTRCIELPGHVSIRVGDVYIEPTLGVTITAAAHKEIVDEQFMPSAPENMRQLFLKYKEHMYVSGNLSLYAEPYVTRAYLHEKAGRTDLGAIRSLQAASLGNQNALYQLYVQGSLRNWFNNELKARHFARAQKLAGIYSELFGNASDEFFAQLAAARAKQTKS